MKDIDGSIIAGARLSELEEIVARLPQGAANYYIMFEGNGAMNRIASFYANRADAEEKSNALRTLNPGFAIRVQPYTKERL